MHYGIQHQENPLLPSEEGTSRIIENPNTSAQPYLNLKTCLRMYLLYRPWFISSFSLYYELNCTSLGTACLGAWSNKSLSP
jgi:hypothetical protein